MVDTLKEALFRQRNFEKILLPIRGRKDVENGNES